MEIDWRSSRWWASSFIFWCLENLEVLNRKCDSLLKLLKVSTENFIRLFKNIHENRKIFIVKLKLTTKFGNFFRKYLGKLLFLLKRRTVVFRHSDSSAPCAVQAASTQPLQSVSASFRRSRLFPKRRNIRFDVSYFVFFSISMNNS